MTGLLVYKRHFLIGMQNKKWCGFHIYYILYFTSTLCSRIILYFAFYNFSSTPNQNLLATPQMLSKATNDIFHFQRRPQCEDKDPHDAVRIAKDYFANKKSFEGVRFWFPYTGDNIGTTIDILRELPKPYATYPQHPQHPQFSPRTYVGYWLHANGFAVLFTTLPSTDKYRSTHVSMALLGVSIPNTDVMSSPAKRVTYPSYDSVWRVNVTAPHNELYEWLKRLEELATCTLPTAVNKRTKGKNECDEERELPSMVSAMNAIIALFSDTNLNVNDRTIPLSQSLFNTVIKTVHCHVEWNDSKLPGRRALSWLAYKAMMRVVLPSRIDYKKLMLDFTTYVFDNASLSWTREQRLEACQKVCRRAKKLSVDVPRRVVDRVAQDEKEWLVSCKNDFTREDDHSKLLDSPDECFRFPMTTVCKYVDRPTGRPVADVPQPSTPPNHMELFYQQYLDTVDAVNHQNTNGVPLKRVSLKSDWTTSKHIEWLRSDPYLYSRALFVMLAQLRQLHMDACKEDPLLNEHEVWLDPRVFTRLLLRHANEMKACRVLENYFARFAKDTQPYYHVLYEEVNTCTYAYRHVTQSSRRDEFKTLEKRLDERSEELKERKRVEIQSWIADCEWRKSNSHAGSGEFFGCHVSECTRCKNYYWMKWNYSARVHEPLLPPEDGANVQRASVLFELDLPPTFARFRDTLYTFQVQWSVGRIYPQSKMEENWQKYINDHAGPNYVTSSTKVTLLSTPKSLLRDHAGEVPYYKGLAAFINTTNPLTTTLAKWCDRGKRACIPASFAFNEDTLSPNYTTHALPPPYHIFRPYLFTESLNGLENRQLTSQDRCPDTLTLPTYHQMCKLTGAGYAQRWDMILKLIESSSPVDLNQLGVFYYVQQVLDQAGPLPDDTLTDVVPTWRRDMHRRVNDNAFCNVLVEHFERLLKNNAQNWQKHLVLRLVVIVMLRVLELRKKTSHSVENTPSNHHQRTHRLLKQCRRVALQWLIELSTCMGERQQQETATEADIAPLRRQMVLVACVGVSTFRSADLHYAKVDTWKDWFTCVNTVKENEPTFATTTSRTTDTVAMDAPFSDTVDPELTFVLRHAEETIVRLRHERKRFTQASQANGRNHRRSQQSLQQMKQMLTTYVTKRQTTTQTPSGPLVWKPVRHNNLTSKEHDGWYETRWKNTTIIHVHIWSGDYMVDGEPVGRLHADVMTHPDYCRLFGRAMLEVLPIGRGGYKTKHTRKVGDDSWHFVFEHPFTTSTNNDDTYQRVIRQVNTHTGADFIYVPYAHLDVEMPTLFRTQWCHWFDVHTTTLHYRPNTLSLRFAAKASRMQWDLHTENICRYTTPAIRETLGYTQHFRRTSFVRLDNITHIALWKVDTTMDASEQPKTHRLHRRIELLRCNYVFDAHYDDAHGTKCIHWISRECAGMCVAPPSLQSLGTLVGLQNRLVLVSLDDTTRSVLVPNVTESAVQQAVWKCHHSTELTLPAENTTTLLLYRYDINNALHMLQPASRNDKEAWLYLIWLHGLTSHLLRDPFTNMSGTQHGLDLLRNVGYPNCPYTSAEHSVLHRIAELSAHRQYYPADKQLMEQIKWHPTRMVSVQTGEWMVQVADHLHQDRMLCSAVEDIDTVDTASELLLKNTLNLYRRALVRHERSSAPVCLHAMMQNHVVWTPPTLQHTVIRCMEISPEHLGNWPSQHIISTECLRTNERYLELAYWDTKAVCEHIVVLYELHRIHYGKPALKTLWMFLLAKHHSNRVCLLSNTLATRVLKWLWNSHRDAEDIVELPEYPTHHIQDAPVAASVFNSPLGVLEQAYDTYQNDHTWSSSETDEKRRDHNRWVNMYTAGEPFHTYGAFWRNGAPHNPSLRTALADCSWASEIKKIVTTAPLHGTSRHSLGGISLPTRCSFIEPLQTSYPHTYDENRWSSPMTVNPDPFHWPSKTPAWDRLCQHFQDTDPTVARLSMGRPVTPLRMLRRLVSGQLQIDIDREAICVIREWGEAMRPTDTSTPFNTTNVSATSAAICPTTSSTDKPEWLALEVLMGIRIRARQRYIAHHMMQQSNLSLTCQLDMGEGKTSVILPMLALSISDGARLCRVQVPSSLLPDNQGTFYWKLGLLGRKCLSVPCTRKAALCPGEMASMYKTLCQHRGILLNAPEHIWSFSLRADTTKQEYVKEVAWIRQNVVDVLDESDEILHPSHRLVYPHGDPRVVDGGPTRWTTIMHVLRCLANEAAHQCSTTIVYRKPQRRGEYPREVRWLKEMSPDVHKTVVRKVLTQIPTTKKLKYKSLHTSWCTSILNPDEEMLPLFTLDKNVKDILYVLRGCVTFGIMDTCMMKRHNVEYGADPARHSPIAVPYLAKGVPTERAEWSHPDAVIAWTYLSWYYTGITRKDFDVVMKHLRTQPANEKRYTEWCNQLHNEEDAVPWASINLGDRAQIHRQYKTFRFQMSVIDYWLSTFVFPVYAKTFPTHQSTSACDIVHAGNQCVGFSGTNGTRQLLPIGIDQYDMDFTKKTNEQVDDLLANQTDGCWQIPDTNTDDQLHTICNLYPKPRVIIDRGATMDDESVVVAQKWFACDETIAGVVYYDKNSVRRIWSSSSVSHGEQYHKSPLCDRFDCLGVYLDDNHTRGVDFVFPYGTHAAVTLGRGVTRDEYAQACKRMRKLHVADNPHTFVVLAPNEVFRELALLGDQRHRGTLPRPSADVVLQWTKQNTRKNNIHLLSGWADHERVFNERRRSHFHTEKDDDTLEQMYGGRQHEQTYNELAGSARYRQLKGVSKRLQQVGDSALVMCYRRTITATVGEVDTIDAIRATDVYETSLTLDEEQERELEQELEEERHVSRPLSRQPHTPTLPHDVLVRLTHTTYQPASTPLIDDPTFAIPAFGELPAKGTSSLYVSREFQKTCEGQTDYNPTTSANTPTFTPYTRQPSYTLVDTLHDHTVAITFEEVAYLWDRLPRCTATNRSARFVVKPTGRRLHSRKQSQMLDEEPRLQMPQSHDTTPSIQHPVILKQSWRLTILTGSTYCSSTHQLEEMKRSQCNTVRWCLFVDGWITTNHTREWVKGSERER